jgi:hypothetical protein
MDGSDVKINCFQAAKSALDARQAFVAGHDLRTGQGLLLHVSADDVNAIQTLFPFDVSGFAFVVKAVAFDAPLKNACPL